MDYNKFKNSIIIVKDSAKESLIKKFCALKKLINVKIITLSELKKKYYFDYTNEAVFHVAKKFNVISEIAKIYIENIYYLKDIPVDKVEFLHNVKNFLEEESLLQKDIFFKNYLQNKKIVLYNLQNVDKFYQSIFEELKKNNEVISYKEPYISTKKKIYKAKNKEEEVSFVAASIAKLIKDGIDINKIKLANVQSDYIYTIKKIFKFFKIPVELPNLASASGTILVNEFKSRYSNNMTSVFEQIKPFVHNKNDEYLYKKLIDIVNDYTWTTNYEEVKTMIFEDIFKIKLPSLKFKNAARIIEFPGSIIEDSDYVFLLNFNQGIIPSDYKNEDFLNDETKVKLDISTSIDKSVSAISDIKESIQKTKNLVATWASHDIKNELYISSAYQEELFEEGEIREDYTLSNAYNLYKLVSFKDEYRKFGTQKSDFVVLNQHYPNLEYCTYNNKFKGLNAQKVYTYIKNQLVLSYTSMNAYFECAFKYYLKFVLKIDRFEDTFMTIIGNIYHKILSECFILNYDFDNCWQREVKAQEYAFNNMEKFFLETLKEELRSIIETIKSQMDYTELKDALYEQEILVPIDVERNISFKGFIDKILYKVYDQETIVSIIDYKTGNPSLNINNAIYGLGMQLPIYVYLLKHFDKFTNMRIGGFYLQKILDSSNDPVNREQSMRWQGFTNSDIEVLRKVDKSYANSQIIKSMKATSNGLYSYAKVLSDEEIDSLANLVEDKIKEAAKSIINGEFTINPKEIENKMYGCKFCNFKSICYMKNGDIVKLKKAESADMGGEVHDEVD